MNKPARTPLLAIEQHKVRSRVAGENYRIGHPELGSVPEVGEDETTLPDMYRFAVIPEGRDYKGFSVSRQMFPDCNHCKVAARAFQAGLRMALGEVVPRLPRKRNAPSAQKRLGRIQKIECGSPI